MSKNTASTALFSRNRRYRYQLARQVGAGERAVMFLMLNPSTAGERTDDQTIRRCIGFARRWHYGWLRVTNLSPFRATHPQDLESAGREPNRVWSRNIEVILETAAVCDLIVAAYGNHGGGNDRAGRVMSHLRNAGRRIHCLGLTRQGHPRHPLRLRADTGLTELIATQQPNIAKWQSFGEK